MNKFSVRALITLILGQPRALPIVVRASWKLRRRQWWRHAPFLPLPSRAYWEFRMNTARGTSKGLPSAQEILDAATWSLQQRVGQ